MSSRSHFATLQTSLLAASLAFAAPALADDVTVTLDAASAASAQPTIGTGESLSLSHASLNLGCSEAAPKVHEKRDASVADDGDRFLGGLGLYHHRDYRRYGERCGESNGFPEPLTLAVDSAGNLSLASSSRSSRATLHGAREDTFAERVARIMEDTTNVGK